MTELPVPHKNRRLSTCLAVGLAIITALVFQSIRHHDFLNWDDQSYVTDNDHVRGGLTKTGVFWAFTESHSGNWHPMTWLSHMLDCQLFGMNSAGHHLINAGLHSINAALLFLLFQSLTGSAWRSALVAALFALHPQRVESVAWLSERKDLLSAFFGMLTLLAYTRYVGESKVQSPKSKVWYNAALLCFALGLMSKPMLVTWPFVMLLLDCWPLRRVAKEGGIWKTEDSKTLWLLIQEKLPFFALVIISCVITVWAQKSGGAVASLEQLPLGTRLQNAALAYVEYLAKFFWPIPLSPIYPHSRNLAAGHVTGALALLLIVTTLVWRSRHRLPSALVGWLWFLGTLVPVIGIVQVGSQALADRYTYLPMIGFSFALVWSGGEFVAKTKLPKIILGVGAMILLALLGWRTTQQLAHWENTGTLFRYTLTHAPDSVQAHYGLGSYLVDHGQVAEGKQHLAEAIRLHPQFAEAIGTLAVALDNEGRYGEAIQQYEAALAAQPDHPVVLNNLAWLRAACPEARFRDGRKAIQLATRACELTRYQKPVFIGTLAAGQAESGDFQTAIQTAIQAATLADGIGLKETAARNRELLELYRNGNAAHGGLPASR